ncbi:V8-like Glu-specific endopeptidase [Streptococcus pneumoniae]|nr:V8-like Glu-specific endopeptidase [Streptococcus pneumoniae]
MKKTVYKKLGISIIASTLLASQLSTVSALSVISSTGEEYEVSETLEKGPESNDSSLSEISPTYGSYYQKQSEVLSFLVCSLIFIEYKELGNRLFLYCVY